MVFGDSVETGGPSSSGSRRRCSERCADCFQFGVLRLEDDLGPTFQVKTEARGACSNQRNSGDGEAEHGDRSPNQMTRQTELLRERAATFARRAGSLGGLEEGRCASLLRNKGSKGPVSPPLLALNREQVGAREKSGEGEYGGRR